MERLVSHPEWSRRHWVAVVAVAAGLLVVHAAVSPGADYHVAYSDMVTKPERLPEVAEYPWTLNPTWMVPFMAPFVSLPGRAGYIGFMAFTLAAFILGPYVLGGKPIPLLLSGHMLWILWWGQLEGWSVLALVLGWYSLKRPSWPWMFMALAMAAFKPQVGLAPVLALWYWSGRDRWKSLAALGVLFLASLLIWGPWPLWYLEGMVKFVGDRHYGPWNASFGIIALPTFVPALLVPLSREKRLIALTAAAYLSFGYLPYYSTILLLCFAVPWWAYVFGFTSYLPTVIGTGWAWNGVVLLPLMTLIWVFFPFLRQTWDSLKDRLRSSG